jgi:hypothetical protein
MCFRLFLGFIEPQITGSSLLYDNLKNPTSYRVSKTRAKVLFQFLRLATWRSPLVLKGEVGKAQANVRAFPTSPFKKWVGRKKPTFAT